MTYLEVPRSDGSITDELATVAETLRESVVHVRNGRSGAGSGVIWQEDGLVITNAHVVRSDTITVELYDGRELDAELIARDEGRDLASLRIRAAGLTASRAADSNTLRVGQLVVALGNPLGMSGALTIGVLHAIAPAEGRGRQDWIQADVRLAPGNSGGPLADAEGRVIGINSMVAGELALAVPSNAVQRFIGNRGERPYLGVTTQPVVLSRENRRLTGLLILDVAQASPAMLAGLAQGDVVIGVDDVLFAHPREFLNALGSVGPGGTVSLRLQRAGIEVQVQVLLGTSSKVERRAAA